MLKSLREEEMMPRKKFFVFIVDSLKNAKVVVPVYKRLLGLRTELGIEIAILVDDSSDAVEYVKGQGVGYVDQVPLDENLKKANSIGIVYSQKFDDWRPCALLVGPKNPVDAYFRDRFTALARERFVPAILMGSEHTADKNVELLKRAFLY